MAAADVRRLVKNAPYRHAFVFRDTDGNVVSSVVDPDSKLSLDTGNPSDATNEATAQTGDFLYFLDLEAGETAADLIEVFITGTGAVAHYAPLKPEPALDSGVAAAVGSSSLTLAATATATTDLYNGAEIEIVRGVGAGQVRTITDYTSSRVATIDRPWITQPNTSSVYLIHPRTGTPHSTAIKVASTIKSVNDDDQAAENMEKFYEGAFVTGSVDDASATATSFVGASGLSSTDDFYGGGGAGKNAFLVFTSGTLAGQAREITDYVGSTRQFTVTAFPSAPGNGDTFLILAVAV